MPYLGWPEVGCKELPCGGCKVCDRYRKFELSFQESVNDGGNLYAWVLRSIRRKGRKREEVVMSGFDIVTQGVELLSERKEVRKVNEDEVAMMVGKKGYCQRAEEGPRASVSSGLVG